MSTKLYIKTVVTKLFVRPASIAIHKLEEWLVLVAGYADDARKWATEDEDVEVADGEYSAYHWAQKAQAVDTSLWELDGADDIKPRNDKTANSQYLSGTLDAGLFHP